MERKPKNDGEMERQQRKKAVHKAHPRSAGGGVLGLYQREATALQVQLQKPRVSTEDLAQKRLLS